jgi:virginiamycin B lyase
MKVKLILITAIVGTAATGLAAAAPTWAATITEFPLATPNSNPQGITAGPDGALWFVEQGSGLGQGDGRIGRIATSGTISEFPIPTPTGVPSQIVAGPEGALWFTDLVSRIGRITTGETSPGSRSPALTTDPWESPPAPTEPCGSPTPSGTASVRVAGDLLEDADHLLTVQFQASGPVGGSFLYT